MNHAQLGTAQMMVSPAVLGEMQTRGSKAMLEAGIRPKAHHYRVVEREEKDGEVFFRAEYFEPPSKE